MGLKLQLVPPCRASQIQAKIDEKIFLAQYQYAACACFSQDVSPFAYKNLSKNGFRSRLLIQQFPSTNLETFSQSLDHKNAGITRTAFKIANVGSVGLRFERKLFLGPLILKPQTAKVFSKAYFDIRGLTCAAVSTISMPPKRYGMKITAALITANRPQS